MRYFKPSRGIIEKTYVTQYQKTTMTSKNARLNINIPNAKHRYVIIFKRKLHDVANGIKI